MTTTNPDSGNAPDFSDAADQAIHKVNDAIDELHIAAELIELIHMANRSEGGNTGSSRAALIAQDHLASALNQLVEARVKLGGPDRVGGRAV